MIDERGLDNVRVRSSRIAEMGAVYAGHHATVLPALDRTRTNPMPNSIVESLACGRPVVVTRCLEVSGYLAGSPAGRVIGPDGQALAGALTELAADWETASPAARAIAEREFSQSRFLSSYQSLYARLLAG